MNNCKSNLPMAGCPNDEPISPVEELIINIRNTIDESANIQTTMMHRLSSCLTPIEQLPGCGEDEAEICTTSDLVNNLTKILNELRYSNDEYRGLLARIEL